MKSISLSFALSPHNIEETGSRAEEPDPKTAGNCWDSVERGFFDRSPLPVEQTSDSFCRLLPFFFLLRFLHTHSFALVDEVVLLTTISTCQTCCRWEFALPKFNFFT